MDPIEPHWWEDRPRYRDHGWRAHRDPRSIRERLSDLTWLPSWSREPAETWDWFQVVVPIWIPLLFAAIPTGVLFWRDRRYPPGHCLSCGYNLTGNTSGRCPECGGEIPCAIGQRRT